MASPNEPQSDALGFEGSATAVQLLDAEGAVLTLN
jgi:hypothetical protein